MIFMMKNDSMCYQSYRNWFCHKRHSYRAKTNLAVSHKRGFLYLFSLVNKLWRGYCVIPLWCGPECLHHCTTMLNRIDPQNIQIQVPTITFSIIKIWIKKPLSTICNINKAEKAARFRMFPTDISWPIYVIQQCTQLSPQIVCRVGRNNTIVIF